MIRATILRLSATVIPFLFGIAACTDAVGVDDRSSATDRGTTTLCFVGDPMADWRVTTRASDVKDEKDTNISKAAISPAIPMHPKTEATTPPDRA